MLETMALRSVLNHWYWEENRRKAHAKACGSYQQKRNIKNGKCKKWREEKRDENEYIQQVRKRIEFERLVEYSPQTPEQSRSKYIQLSAELARISSKMQQLKIRLLKVNAATGLPANFQELSLEADNLQQKMCRVKEEWMKSFNDPKNKWWKTVQQENNSQFMCAQAVRSMQTAPNYENPK